MEEPELDRAVAAARTYVSTTMSGADLVAIASFSTTLRVEQDFTDDRDKLMAALDVMDGTSATGLAAATGSADAVPDTGNAFTADETEYNIFTNDRRLLAIQTLANALGGIDQKKSVIYFSSGLTQSDQDNQVQLRRTVNDAVRANVSIYAPDMRGLQAVVPGGAASRGSVGGQSPYSGASVLGQFSDLSASQDTLATLGEDTGGRAFLDANRFDDVFAQVIADTSTYYVLGYASTNPARDGRFRRIAVRVSRPNVKIEYRAGYYAARDFSHSTRADRDAALQEQLLTDISATDLSSYASAAYFRSSNNRFRVALSIVVPGNRLPFTAATPARAASIDILGIVEDGRKRPMARIRDTLRVNVSDEAFRRKLVQYETTVELEPGRYRFKVVLRENQEGTLGSYEMPLVVPQFDGGAVKMSSVVLGTQLQPGAQRRDDPLVVDGRKLVPNVTHVVSPGQPLYFFYEMYDPATEGSTSSTDVSTSISFFRGQVRAFETTPVNAPALTASSRHAVAFQVQVPPSSLPPGLYTCQVTLVDAAARKFGFTRFQLYVNGPAVRTSASSGSADR
jgi:VWFA-related protein